MPVQRIICLKRSRDFLLCTKKEVTVYYVYVNIWVRACYFYSPRNQTTSCQYKFSKKTIAVHYRFTIGLAVLESKKNIAE